MTTTNISCSQEGNNRNNNNNERNNKNEKEKLIQINIHVA